MEQQGYGRIVFCSSIATGEFVTICLDSALMTFRSATGGVLGPHYASSKAALHGIMHWVARQYSKKGIVCTVSPS
jgi:3-oxoacyl-[acyl-carrier protein] reductase